MSTPALLPGPWRPLPARLWLDGWWAVCHLALTVLLLGWYVTLFVLLVLGTALTPVFLTGVPLLLLARVGIRASQWVERWRQEALLGEAMPAQPVRVSPDARPWWRRWLLDAQPWRTGLHLLLVSTYGAVAAGVVVGLTGAALGALAAPLAAGGDLAWPFVQPALPMPVPVPVVVVAAVLLLLLVPLLARALVVPETAAARALLGPTRSAREAVLERRVESLTVTRERAVDSVEAERRRIERDLHDGPQQRLVALAMQLGMAQRALERDPAAAQRLLDKAHGTAKEAISDMRFVARGIHPPVLTDRGLDAALSALAASSAVPVRVDVDLDPARDGRPSATSEAIAYFCVSEALTNVAKHAGATRAHVEVRRDGDLLVLRVSDDGVGGACPSEVPVPAGVSGSGLRGLADRVASVDGWIHLDSPVGGPTVLTAGLPWDRRDGSGSRGGAR
ncbi:putative sensor protein [Kineococcus xinjiangensis]|uniref:histidine kinase n=1 Tax=Kineococcus xinjiangensis TaxID=512762 RepID=A0A2S6IG37_9ACTN|nr:sensor histidine kinase [Kineococcus xinjiangensis]PPK93120.1 putative sensor protein [Kineococcus xinjiangensis]